MDSHRLLERIARFRGSHQGGVTLAPMEKLLDKMGHPQKKCPPVIHVAGTNGKGSVTAFLKSCLEQAGLRVHRFTSPHLSSYTERIEIYGIPIAPEKLEYYLDICSGFLSVMDISVFEALTASAFLAFSEHPADIAVMEVGLGGIWDATNCVTTTCASVITSLSKDHVHILGPHLTDIARNKAGIMRRDIPCVLSPQDINVTHFFSEEAQRKGAPIFLYERDWRITIDDDIFHLTLANCEENFWYPHPQLLGEHQIFNGTTAVVALKKQNVYRIAEEHLRAGIWHAVWPGRLEKINCGAVTSCFSKNWEMWIDGAHNVGGAMALKKYIMTQWNDSPLVIVLSIVKTKDSKKVLEILSPLSQVLCFLDSPELSHEFIPAEVLLQQTEAIHVSCPVFSYGTIEDFLSHAPKDLPSFPFCRILFCGSLYGIAALREYNIQGYIG